MKVLDAIVRIAVQLATAGIVGQLTRIAVTGKVTLAMLVVMIGTAITVAALLLLAHRLEKHHKDDK